MDVFFSFFINVNRIKYCARGDEIFLIFFSRRAKEQARSSGVKLIVSNQRCNYCVKTKKNYIKIKSTVMCTRKVV